MKKFFRPTVPASTAVDASEAIQGVLQTVSPDAAKHSITMMSLKDDSALEKTYNDRQDVSDSLASIFNDKLTDAQRQAGTSAVFQAANIDEHISASVSGVRKVDSDYSQALSLRGQGGDISQVNLNMQSYEDRDFSKYRDSSVAFNMATAEQDAVSELFFPSLLLPNDAPVLRCTLRSTIVQRNVQHSRSGQATDLNRKNLANAYTDPSILENNSTEVHPIVAADNSNVGKFVDANRVAPYDITVDGEVNKTAPLRTGSDGNLLGLASAGSFAPEEGYTAYDQLNPRALLSTVEVEVTDGTETSQLSFKVKNLPRANFVKAPQQNTNEEFMLRFSTDVLTISAETQDRDAAAAAALAGLPAGVSVRLRLSVNATLSLNTSNYTIDVPSVEVIGAFDQSGKVEITGALETAVEKLAFDAYGVTFGDITRTNRNRSTLGLWVDTTTHVRDFAIHAQPPIYHPLPDDQTPRQDVVDSLILSSKAVSTNRTIAAMRNHLNTLAAFVDMGATGAAGVKSSEMFPGAADEVTPYYKSVPLAIKTMLNSISTHEKADDIRGIFTTVLTHYVAQMINRSNIETATAMLHGKVKKPKIIIATDPEIAPWLMISGDSDLLGRMVDYKVATSVHPDMEGKIIVSFASDTSIDGIDPCGFGRRGWVTELVATQKVQRGESSNTEVVIQPRELPVATLPVALEFTVTELTEAVEESL